MPKEYDRELEDLFLGVSDLAAQLASSNGYTYEDMRPSFDQAKQAVTALIDKQTREARVDELERNAYYSQPRKGDPLKLCGIDMTEEQVNERISELKKEDN